MTMRRISEEDAWASAGDDEPPVLAKTEWDATESAVTLKRWPNFLLLGVSCDSDDRFELYAFDEEGEGWEAYERHVARLRETGRPFMD
jgi:hypothetical protein